MRNEESLERLIALLERQLSESNNRNEELVRQVAHLSEQVRQLTKALYAPKSEKEKYQAPEGQGSLFEDDPSFNDSEHTEEQRAGTVQYTVVRKLKKKKRNDSFKDGIEVEEILHHPTDLHCDSCHHELQEIGSVVAREEAKFIPAKMVRIQHIEHAYECTACKAATEKPAQIKRGKAPLAVIPRSIAGPTVLAKLIYDKFIQYLPLYRQVKEWDRAGLMTNDKNLSNWVIRSTDEWLDPIYERMKSKLLEKSILHIDETYAQVLNRSDGRPARSNAYNWVFRTVPAQGPVIVLFQNALSRSRNVLEQFTQGFRGTVVCDGYAAYNHLPGVDFANCWAHVRRYWLRADSKQGRVGVSYCNRLYDLERQFKDLSPGKRRKMRKKFSKPIVEEFFRWIDESPFFGKNALATAADYTFKRMVPLKAFLHDGRIEIDNNPAENAIRPTVIGRKNWLFSVSESGARANAICLSIAETAKANGIDFYQYLVKLLSELPSLDITRNPDILEDYLPWSTKIKASCSKI